MTAQKFEVTLPKGRIVSGHPMTLTQSENFQTKAKEFKQDGTPKLECYFQVAVPKNDPELNKVWPIFLQAAGRPQLDIGGAFAWKINDGDGQRINQTTKQPEAYPEYCRGCWLFSIKSHGWVSKVVYFDGAQWQEVADKSMLKTGDYAQVALRLEHNGAVGNQEGIYVNPSLVVLVGQGDAIGGAGYGVGDAAAIFGNVQAYTPTAQPAMTAAAAPGMGAQMPHPGMGAQMPHPGMGAQMPHPGMGAQMPQQQTPLQHAPGQPMPGQPMPGQPAAAAPGMGAQMPQQQTPLQHAPGAAPGQGTPAGYPVQSGTASPSNVMPHHGILQPQ